MRILEINGIKINIDDNTAIGIDLQAYDIKQPAKSKVKISNSFSIPKTLNNLKAIGYVGGSQNISNSIYGIHVCNYWVDNVQFIKDAKVRIENIDSRINLFVFEKPSIWDILKSVTWLEFIQGYFDWLNIPKYGSEETTLTYSEYIDLLIADGGHENIFLPLMRTNTTEGDGEILLADTQSGGHLCSFFKPVFEYIEQTYDVDFGTSGTFDYNIFNDAYFTTEYWLLRDLLFVDAAAGLTFFLQTDPASIPDGVNTYENNFRAEETRDKTLYDFVTAILQKYNAIVVDIDGQLRIRRFDDIVNGSVVDFSSNISGAKFKPYIDGYSQNSRIKCKKVETGINELTNSRLITCQNKSLEESSELFSIEMFIPTYTNDNGTYNNYIPVLNTQDSFKTFKFFRNGNQETANVDIKTFGHDTGQVSVTKTGLWVANIYSLDSEYTLLNEAMQYPVFYEIQKWMTSNEVLNFDYFKQYYIKQLGGSFFVNKIKGFNPDKSKQATTIELFKISDKTPLGDVGSLDYWTDGFGTIFTDGFGNKFYTNT